MVQMGLPAGQETAHESGANILDRAVLLSLTISKFGISKKVSVSEIEADADKALLKVSKRILDSPEYDAIGKTDSAFRSLLGDLALPSMFRAGVYAIPLGLLDRIDGELGQYIQRRRLLVAAFGRVAAEQLRATNERLRGLGDDETPDVDKILRAFGVEYRYVSTAPPEKLRTIRADIFARESTKAHADVAAMVDEVKSVLRQAMRDLCGHCADKLQPKADGSSQIFRDSMVGNIRDFLTTFQARNIADDAELGAIVADVEGLLSGVTPEALRSDAALRDEVQGAFAGFKVALDAMLTDAPRRRIDLS